MPETKTGLYCFMDSNRPCGADCMAYESAPNHKDFVGKQWSSCILLINTHRVGKHLTIIAQSLDTIVKAKQDEARIPTPPPPVR